ncbi:TPA: type II toxin-antitoxin system SpoIISA family toxin [Bacillus cereus]
MIFAGKVALWFAVVYLFTYLILFSFTDKLTKKDSRFNILLFRKFWYLLFVIGACYVVTNYSITDKNSLHFLYAFISAVLIDIAVFQTPLVKKIGPAELNEPIEALKDSNQLVLSFGEKMKSLVTYIGDVTIEENIQDDTMYITGLSNVLRNYGEENKIEVSLSRFSSQEEMRGLIDLLSLDNRTEAIGTLVDKKTFYSKDSKIALAPITVLEQEYILQISSKKVITEIDVDICFLLIHVYDLAICERDERGAVENGENV